MNVSKLKNQVSKSRSTIANKKDRFTLKNNTVKFITRIPLLILTINLQDGISNIRSHRLI